MKTSSSLIDTVYINKTLQMWLYSCCLAVCLMLSVHQDALLLMLTMETVTLLQYDDALDKSD